MKFSEIFRGWADWAQEMGFWGALCLLAAVGTVMGVAPTPVPTKVASSTITAADLFTLVSWMQSETVNSMLIDFSLRGSRSDLTQT